MFTNATCEHPLLLLSRGKIQEIEILNVIFWTYLFNYESYFQINYTLNDKLLNEINKEWLIYYYNYL